MLPRCIISFILMGIMMPYAHANNETLPSYMEESLNSPTKECVPLFAVIPFYDHSNMVPSQVKIEVHVKTTNNMPDCTAELYFLSQDEQVISSRTVAIQSMIMDTQDQRHQVSIQPTTILKPNMSYQLMWQHKELISFTTNHQKPWIM